MYLYFPGDSVVKNLPSNAAGASSIVGQGTRIPHVLGQLSPCAATTEPSCHNHSGMCCLTATAYCKPTVSESVLDAFQHYLTFSLVQFSLSVVSDSASP